MTKIRNRGQHPNDHKLFNEKWWPVFREAVDDLCYLLSKKYGSNGALQIVGNRYKLNKRQRIAIQRMSASKRDIEIRKHKQISIEQIKEGKIAIDGFNLLILLESILSGAYFFRCRDGSYRDISSVHGSYKRVAKTEEAIQLIGETLKNFGVDSVLWLLDEPISNSGRLKILLLEIAKTYNFPWEVQLVYNPDRALIESGATVISSDGWVINESKAWFNMPAYLLEYGFLLKGNCIAV